MTTCHMCSKEVDHSECGQAGEGSEPRAYCYPCCAIRDLAAMRATGKATLYLTRTPGDGFEVGNWPGSLKIPVLNYKESRHNLGRTRTDVWFRVDGKPWHGYQIGDNSQLCHCKQLKEVK